MEDKGKKCVSGQASFPNRPPVSPKPFTAVDLLQVRVNMHYDFQKALFFVRRSLSNRFSAQKSRMRKLLFINDLERKRKDLEMEIAKLGPLVENEQEKLKQLQMENHFLQERMSVYEAKAKLSIALVEENQAAVRRLKEAYAAQQRNMYAMQAGEGQYWNSSSSSSSNARRVNGHEQQMMRGDSSSPTPLMAEDQALSFTSLTIDPPKSLHDDDAKY